MDQFLECKIKINQEIHIKKWKNEYNTQKKKNNKESNWDWEKIFFYVRVELFLKNIMILNYKVVFDWF